MLGLVQGLIRQLDLNQVRYVHFKSNEHIGQSVEGETDFDILVDRSSAGSFETVLRGLDFKRFQSPKRAAYPGVDDWLGMDEKTGRFVHLHTHYQLITGKFGYKNYVLPWAQIALSSREKDPETGIYFVSPEFELIELYTRIIAKIPRDKDWKAMAKGYTLKGDNRKEAEWLWQRASDDRLQEMIETCFCSHGETLTTEVFHREHFSAGEYRAFRKTVLGLLSFHERAGMEWVNLRSRCWKYIAKVQKKIKKLGFFPGIQQRKFCHDGGLFIAFLGVDGSGKTTVAEEIHSWLSWKIEASRISLGVGRFKQTWQFRLKQKIKKLLGRSTAPEKSKGLTSDKPMKKSFKAWKNQRKKLAFAKEVRRDIQKIHGYCLNGGIMVADRYPQLAYFGISDGPKVNAAYPELQEKERQALNIVDEIQPDIVFKLMVPVEVSMQRRPEDSPEVLQRKYDILCQLQYPNSVVLEVDATQSLEQELLFIKKKIWEQL